MSGMSLSTQLVRWRISTQACLLIFLGLKVAALCYFPDGTRLFADQPCLGNGTEDSFCCGPQATCLSDKLCWDGGSGYVRGSCTDVTWKSSACPNFCLNKKDGAGVMDDCKDPHADSWCCQDSNVACDCSKGNVTFPSPRALVSTIPFPGRLASTTSQSTSAPSSRSTASSSTPPPSSLQLPKSSSASAASTAATPTVISASKSKNTNLGAAVGAPVSVVSLAFILLLLGFIRYRRRTNRKLRELQDQITAGGHRIEKSLGQRSTSLEMNAAEQNHELGPGRSHELPVGSAA